jgi:hypothetical protein
MKTEYIPLSVAARIVPGRPSIRTVWRWTTRGIGGHRLESIKVGGKRLTTERAIRDFLRYCNESSPAHSEADDELSADGI